MVREVFFMRTVYDLVELALAVTGCVFLLLSLAFRLRVWQTGRWTAVLPAADGVPQTVRRAVHLRRLLEFCGLEKQVALCVETENDPADALRQALDETLGEGAVTCVTRAAPKPKDS